MHKAKIAIHRGRFALQRNDLAISVSSGIQVILPVIGEGELKMKLSVEGIGGNCPTKLLNGDFEFCESGGNR
jgi:hypothetical protein